MTSQLDPLEQLVRSAADRATRSGLVVLDRSEVSLAAVTTGARFFLCVDPDLLLYRLTSAAYAFLEGRSRLLPSGSMKHLGGQSRDVGLDPEVPPKPSA